MPCRKNFTSPNFQKIWHLRGKKIIIELLETRLLPCMTRWWLNQPIWKICSSNWIISPSSGWKQKIFELPPARWFWRPALELYWTTSFLSSFYAPQKIRKKKHLIPIQPQLLICRLSWGKCPPRNQWIPWNFNGFFMFFLNQISKCACISYIWSFGHCAYPELHTFKKTIQSIQLTNPSSNFHWTDGQKCWS